MTGALVEFTHHDHQDSVYTTKIGLIFRKTLTITEEGLRWKNRFIHFNDIAATGWGGLYPIYSFIPTGTIYCILLQDDRDRFPTQIVTRRKSVYKKIVEQLWEHACSRLMISLLVGLQHGKRYRFSSAVIDDRGLYISRPRLLRPSEMFYFTWDRVDLWSNNGQLFIGQRNGLFHQLPYASCDNIHLLEAMVSSAIEHGYDQLSQLLE